MKLFLTGPLDVGKTHIINACLRAFTGKLWGFRSYKEALSNDEAIIWLSEASHPERRWIAAHMVAGQPTERHPEAFEEKGVALMQKITPASRGIVLMDEIGRLESDAPSFRRELERVLGLDIPVLGVLRQTETPFLQKLRGDERLTVLEVSLENRDALPARCRAMLGLPEAPARPVSR